MNAQTPSQAVTPLTSVTAWLSLLVFLMIPAGLLAGQGEPPRSYSQTALPLATVQQVVLPAVDTKVLLAADAASRPGPLLYAVPRSVEITPRRMAPGRNCQVATACGACGSQCLGPLT